MYYCCLAAHISPTQAHTQERVARRSHFPHPGKHARKSGEALTFPPPRHTRKKEWQGAHISPTQAHTQERVARRKDVTASSIRYYMETRNILNSLRNFKTDWSFL